MPIGLSLAFVAATAVLVVIPGPNVALVVANSVAYGRRFGLVTAAGTTSAALLPQLAFITLGMTGSLILAGRFFDWVRWAGVAYLAYLGVTAWRAPVLDLTQVVPEPRSARAIFARGVLVSLTNPKSLLCHGAFFPQFITPGPHLLRQIDAALRDVPDHCGRPCMIAAGRSRPVGYARSWPRADGCGTD